MKSTTPSRWLGTSCFSSAVSLQSAITTGSVGPTWGIAIDCSDLPDTLLPFPPWSDWLPPAFGSEWESLPDEEKIEFPAQTTKIRATTPTGPHKAMRFGIGGSPNFCYLGTSGPAP